MSKHPVQNGPGPAQDHWTWTHTDPKPGPGTFLVHTRKHKRASDFLASCFILTYVCLLWNLQIKIVGDRPDWLEFV